MAQVFGLFPSSGGPWIPDWELAPIRRIPERRTKRQALQEERDRFRNALLPPDREVLGTSTGLLINDLIHAPDAVLEPILSMMYATKELLANSGVHSPDATFVLFMVQLGMDVVSYIDFVLNLHPNAGANTTRLRHFRSKLQVFFHGPIAETLNRWSKEADSLNDLPTACVVHSFIALLYATSVVSSSFDSSTSSSEQEMKQQEEIVVKLLGSLTFVRNWHGFGMGLLRSNYSNTMDPVDRLVRFLQAHGIDTSRTDKKSLAKWTTGGRPLYLKVGRETVRAPTFASPELDKSKLPPADVPEAALFRMFQKVRRKVVQFLDNCKPKNLDHILNKIMAVALRNEDFVFDNWAATGEGCYTADAIELKFDVQSAEVLWKNDELKPVPDSMTQYNDYDSLFGREPMHCGVVKKEEHRNWVHLVGKEYDLAEWDEGLKTEQGVGFPEIVKKPEPERALFWPCPICTVLNEGGEVCSVCDTPRPPPEGGESGGAPAAGKGKGKKGAGKKGGDQGPPPPEDLRFGGVLYSRKFDPYDEKPHEHPSENWFVDLLKPIILHQFPPEKPMMYTLLLPETAYPENVNTVNLLGFANPDKDNATWKEFQVVRDPAVVHVYNLLPHGRRAYRSQIYTSDSRLSHHSLPVSVQDRSGSIPKQCTYEAGDMNEYRKPGGSLVIMRPCSAKNHKDEGGPAYDCYIPARLLQGVIPGVLLEAFRFWQDANTHVLHGVPLDDVSQWFNYGLEVKLDADKTKIFRKPLIVGKSMQAKTAISLLRTSSQRQNVRESSNESEAVLLQLINLGFSPAACRLALERVGVSSTAERAANWLFDDSNAAAISAADQAMLEEEINEEDDEIVQDVDSIGRRVNNMQVDPVVAQGAAAQGGVVGTSSTANGGIFSPPPRRGGSGLEVAEAGERVMVLTDVGTVPMEVDDSRASRRERSPQNKTESDPKRRKVDGSLRSEQDSSRESRRDEDWVLLNILHASNAQLREVLTRIEDVSHILVWTHQARIVSVELPRLKLRFTPKQHGGGGITTKITRLHLADADDWFLTDFYAEADADAMEVESSAEDTLSAERASLQKLLAGLPHTLLLQNEANEFEVLLCNHDVHRPMVRGAPFSTQLVFDRRKPRRSGKRLWSGGSTCCRCPRG